MIVTAIFFAGMALLFAMILKRRMETGSLIASPHPGMGLGRTTREKHPIFFWLWNVQIAGATLMCSAIAVLCVTDAMGITNLFEGAGAESNPILNRNAE